MQLKRRAEEIEKSTRDTSEQLAEQSAHTGALVEHANRLVEAVRVFQLPETAGDGGQAREPARPAAEEAPLLAASA